MKLKSLLAAFLVMLATFALAQVEAGKVYRIVNAKYGTVMSESPILHTLSCASAGTATDYHEMWKFNAADDGKFTIQNVYTQRYIQYETGRNVVWRTASQIVKFSVVATPGLNGCYNIDRAAGNNWGAHCDGSGNIVPWTYGTNEISGTEWKFEEVKISEAEIAAAAAAYLSREKKIEVLSDIVGAEIVAIDAKVATEVYNKTNKALERKVMDAFEANVVVFVPNGDLGEIITVEPIAIDGGTYATFYGGRLLLTVDVDAKYKCQSFNTEMTSLVVANRAHEMLYLFPNA